MRGRWSFGVVAAIAVAIAMVASGQFQAAPARQPTASVQVALVLQPDGVSLRVSHDALAITFKL